MSDLQTFNDIILSINKKILFKRYENNECRICAELVNDLSELQKNISSDDEKIRWIDFVASIDADMSFMLLDYAMKQHEMCCFDISGYAYVRCIQIIKGSKDTAKNNLAYILRRNESSFSSLFSTSEIVTLLESGLENENVFSIVNLALTFILKSGEEQDWRLADDLFSSLNEGDDDISNANSWWEKVGETGDIEGFLVHFFLLRHQKIEFSDLGTIKSLAIRLSKNIGSFPKWLAEDYKLETLDDVIDCMEDPDFDSILEDFLENMPASRDNTNEMLDTVAVWDLWQVYHKLLTDCVAFLIPDEIERLRADYKAKFSIPLPDEEE